MIVRDKYRLRMIESSDLDFVKDIRLNSSTSKYLGTYIFLNNEMQEAWYESLCKRTDYMLLIFEVYCEEYKRWSKAGYARLSEIDRVNLSVCIGADMALEYRGKGLSRELYSLIFELCFNNWNMNRLWLLVLDYNKIARRLYGELGFVEEGTQRSAIFRDGCFHDYIMMSLLRGEFDE